MTATASVPAVSIRKEEASERATPSARLQPAPLVGAVLAFAVGIVLAGKVWRPPVWWIVAAAFVLVTAAFFYRRALYPTLPLWPARLLCLTSLIFLGAVNLQLRQLTAPHIENDDRFARITDGREVVAEGYALRDGLRRPSAFGGEAQLVDVAVERVRDGAADLPLHFSLRLNIYSQGSDSEQTETTAEPGRNPKLLYGERLRFPAKLRQPRNFMNPGAFDERGYLEQQGIAALGSVRVDNVERLPGSSGTWWQQRLFAARRSLIAKIHLLWQEKDAELLAALIVGDRTGLDRETLTDYQRTGAYHILVVAGLKVGILALVIMWLLRCLRLNEWLATAGTIVATILYCLITDGGAPVIRATVMLVLYLVARLLYRDRNHLNAIAAAGLLMLLWDARSLFDAGFQLSFISVLAIAGIALPLLERTVEPYRRALKNFDSTEYDMQMPPRLAQFRLDLRMIIDRAAILLDNKKPARKVVSWVIIRGWRLAIGSVEVIVISVVLQLSLALPMAIYFHRAMTLSLPTNMVIVPLHGILLPVAGLALLLAYIWPPLAHVPAGITALLVHGMNHVVERLARLHLHDLAMSDLRVADPSWCMAMLVGATVVFAMLAPRWAAAGKRGGRMLTLASLLLLLAGNVALPIPPRPQLQPGMLEVTAIDVGQGDSILVVTPEGRTLLIDGGGSLGAEGRFDTGEDVVSPYLWSRGFTHLDAVALTHAHADHIGGLHSVLLNFRPRELWLGPEPMTPPITALLAQAKLANISVVNRNEAEEFSFGGANFHVLAPPHDWALHERAENNDSLVMKVAYGQTSALLEGDAEKKIEHLLANEDVSAGLLKVGHHGSSTSTQPELLTAVHPQFAVISVGYRSPFGHPRKDVLERLEHAHVKTFRTDTMGAVTFYLDGKSIAAKLAIER
jgi:competence protein ComEC